jgi:hypothetical protein
MTQWTETARRSLDEYCARSKAALGGTGADGDEVIDDLRRHVDEEIRAAGLTVVTEDDIRRILGRVGEPGAAIEPKTEANPPPPSSAPAPKAEKQRPGYILLVMGVVFPLITFLFEWFTGISAGVLFDPLPNWFFILAVALVPAANLWIWLAGRARDARHAVWLGWLNGAALGVCLFYSILYLPFAPFAGMAIIFFGAGLIPLGPYFALVATLFLRAGYQKRIGQVALPRAWKGTLVAFGLLVLLQLPTALTYYGLARAASEDAGNRLQGVRILRNYGDRELILRGCYGMLRRTLNLDLVRLLASGNEIVSADQAREIYYRVTGKPFNAVPPPALYTRMGRWSALDEEFTWDDALGGEAVAGRVKGLSLSGSRMDAVAEPEASLVYCEWTMEFKNISRQQREARAQIALPPGAVVSRVTLWINGEEREAAFGGRSQVREAYKEVAVVRRRDPVLVTTCGPDRVLMQCFPVPPDGGVMKVRIGITAPLALVSPDQGRFVWPRFLERNFGIGPDLKHALWIESPTALTPEKGGQVSTQTGARPVTFHETISDTTLATSPETIVVRLPAGVGSVWTPATEPGRIIRQTIQPVAPALPSRLVVVLDGSEGMQSNAREFAEALATIPETTEIAVIIANDQKKEFNARPQKATAVVIKEIQQSIRQFHFAGGQDNLPALEAAWDLAAAADHGAVVWIHQPQPVLLASESGLRQRLERTAAPVRLFEIQTRNGPDRIIEKLDGISAVEQVQRLGSVRSNFDQLLARWTGKTPTFNLVREQVAAPTEAAHGTRVGKHIERLWARDEALRLAAQRQRDAAVKLAAENQLVTPLTGAVVLETKEQYDRHNLKPADPTTVPAVPEPQTWLLVGAAILTWALRGSFRRRSPSTKRRP